MARTPLMLRKLLIVLVASLIATPITVAETPRKRAKAAVAVKPSQGHQQGHGPQRVYDGRDRWYPNDANQLRFGSQIWWDQMQREGRIGRPSTD